jgi:hypothetical protein
VHTSGSILEALSKSVGVLPFAAKVELERDRLRELLHQSDRIEASGVRDVVAHEARQKRQNLQIGLDLGFNAARCTLTTTSMPSGSLAAWTWASEAAAMGTFSKLENSSLTDRPSSRWMMRFA